MREAGSQSGLASFEIASTPTAGPELCLAGYQLNAVDSQRLARAAQAKVVQDIKSYVHPVVSSYPAQNLIQRGRFLCGFMN